MSLNFDPQAESRDIAHQFRMRRLQVYNWGTFSNLHTIDISERGFLFTGRSGSGKSTLLDAIAAMLTPPKWVDFNAAAREADRSGKDRNLVSYVRGAWAEQKDSDSGDIATQYLREGPTWSALGLTYKNESGRTCSLVQLFYIKGTTSDPRELQRWFFIFERPFELSEFEGFDLDIRKVKQKFGDEAWMRNEFRPYSERFRRLLGIENEMALRLLHKTQSAKNLGDLNLFLRDFMLDKPDTFDVADRLVDEFSELDAAHKSVLTARMQVETLLPARDTFEELECHKEQRRAVEHVQAGIDGYKEDLRCRLLREAIKEHSDKSEELAARLDHAHGVMDNAKQELGVLEAQHRDMGGGLIERLESEREQVEKSRTERLAKRKQAQDACRFLGYAEPQEPALFAQLVSRAKSALDQWKAQAAELRSRQIDLAALKASVDKDLAQTQVELAELRQQSSNLPAEMLHLRRRIAQAINVHEESLPFAGELIEVRAGEASWRGAIERLLHGLALSMLVEERYYNAVSNYVNNNDLKGKLVYFRTGGQEQLREPMANGVPVLSKLNIKSGAHNTWLTGELKNRYNYDCVSSVQALRAAKGGAITIEGLIKSGKLRHEKDDRRSISDRRNWFLGFDNAEKIALYKKQEEELIEKRQTILVEINALAASEEKQQQNALCCQTLCNLQWNEIDVDTIVERLSALDKQIAQAKKGDRELEKIAEKIKRQKDKVSKCEKDVQNLTAERISLNKEIDKISARLLSGEELLGSLPCDDQQKAALDIRFQSESVSLDNLDKAATRVERALAGDINELTEKMSDCKQSVEAAFADFKRKWAAESANMDTTLASGQDYFALLIRLETDNLPAFEDRFFELLQNQSTQNLAALSTHISQARNAIYERMDLVNESLARAPFNPGTHLYIQTQDKQLVEVQDFRREIHEALSHAFSQDREQAESRFDVLRGIVSRLASQDPLEKRWRDLVLDVRQHVEFVGQELDSDNQLVEIYRSGAGKSGGQRQKLATTCLAAALNYQLSRGEEALPTYAAVVLDEAFDKADNEFTALSMNIFDQFGFQMIVATPLKSVMTLEPFIGGASFVEIRDRKHSSVLAVQYDSSQSRLDFKGVVDAGTASQVS